MITIVTPADSRALLTDPQLCLAVGVDAVTPTLTALGLQVSDRITQMCKVASDGVSVPTLMSETITETFRDVCRVNVLPFGRNPVTEIVSVVEDGVTLDPDDQFERDGQMLHRLSDDRRIRWSAKKIVNTYKAGFVTVPEDMVLAASLYVKLLWDGQDRDQTKKSETVEGMGRDEWFEGDTAVMDRVRELIQPFIQY